MSAFAQDNTGDLDITSGNLVVRSDVAQVTAWKLSNLFAFFKGEWFRDKRVGVPYFQYVLVNNPNLPVIGSIFRQVALAAPGVSTITDITLDFTARTRSLVATLSLITNDGAKLVGGPGKPFIIVSQQGG